jgi:hypothetical protein
MRRVVGVSAGVLATAFAATAASQAGTTASSTEFRTPDGGAACRLEGTTLVCSARGSAGSVALRPADVPRIVRRAPWWDESTPVIRRWRKGVLSCRLTGPALVCRNDRAAIRVGAGGFTLL